MHPTFSLRKPLASISLLTLLTWQLGLVAAPAAVGDRAAARAPRFSVASDDLAHHGMLSERHVLNGFGRQGQNQSPHLRWEHAPAGTKSFVVTVYDPDAPTGSGWWHWVVVDIPAHVRELPAGASLKKDNLPASARETRTDFGKPGYGGAAPPAGEIHRYVFTVHALDFERLEVPEDASPAMIGFLVHSHSLGSASLRVLYGP